MVTEEEYRDYPQYALDSVRELAAAGAVMYGFSKVESNVASLGYDLNDVCTCLGLLESKHYQKSVRYNKRGPWLDVYLIQVKFKGAAEFNDDLYIKLTIDMQRMIVVLASFHPERY